MLIDYKKIKTLEQAITTFLLWINIHNHLLKHIQISLAVSDNPHDLLWDPEACLRNEKKISHDLLKYF